MLNILVLLYSKAMFVEHLSLVVQQGNAAQQVAAKKGVQALRPSYSRLQSSSILAQEELGIVKLHKAATTI